MGVMGVKGCFASFSGTVDLAEQFERSRVEGVVEASSIDTRIRKRDDHLRSGAFFDAARFPWMEFKSVRITGTLESFEMEGELTIRGITRPVRFTCNVAEEPAAGTLVVVARAAINRRDFGITFNPLIGERVAIFIKAVAVKMR